MITADDSQLLQDAERAAVAQKFQQLRQAYHQKRMAAAKNAKDTKNPEILESLTF